MSRTIADSEIISEYPEDAANSGVHNALVVREQELANYSALGFPPQMQWQEPRNASGISLTKILHAFRRRWLLATFVAGLLAMIGTTITWFLLPSRFEVEAMLEFENSQGMMRGRQAYTNPQAEEIFRANEAQKIISRQILVAAIRSPAISNLSILKREGGEPIAFLEKSLQVYVPKGSGILYIKMVGDNAKDMVQIVRSITDTYLKEMARDEKTQRSRVYESVNTRLTESKKDFNKQTEQYIALARASGSQASQETKGKESALQFQIQELSSDLRQQKLRLGDVRIELARAQSREKKMASGDVPEDILNLEMMNNPQMIELVKMQSELQTVLQQQQQISRNLRDPSVRRFQERLAGVNEQIEKLKVTLRPAMIIKYLQGNSSQSFESVEGLQAQVKVLEDLVKDLHEQLQAKTDDLAILSKDNAELLARKEMLETIAKTNNELSARLNELALEQDNPMPVGLLKEADEPEGSSILYRAIITSLVGLLCLCVGLGSVVMLEYTKQRVSSLSEVGHGGLGIRVLGTVPNFARLARSNSPAAGQTVSGILAESIDSVRTMLLGGKRSDSPRVILVTSADEHEGKTTVATHLAASLARAGRRTLLADGDLRKPSIHTLFDQPMQAGLCEVLRDEVEVESVIQPAQVEGMWLLFAGQCDQLALASLAKESGESAFRTLRADYDFVIIDTGPVLNFADTLLMGSHADAAVLTILRDVSQIPKVYEARERLEAVGVPVLGGVVGGVASHMSRSYAIPMA
ncbi:MAG: polysaccharide biosynthesis tyrosine autokinase [Planctomycetota bacterium]|nr:polysaccharide biosynthesis tyrosine autokinase [Planctomycetota bacterium]